MKVVLVGCSKSKAPRAEVARKFYTGGLFKLSAELEALGWRSGVVWEHSLKKPAQAAALASKLSRRLKPATLAAEPNGQAL